MRRMDNLREMALCLPPAIVTSMAAVIADLADYLDGVEPGEASFADLLDSPAYLVEAVEDLAHVRSFEERGGARLSLLDGPSGWFDIAEWLDNGNFARFVSIDSSEGGAQFFIPRAIADKVASVSESIERKQISAA